MKVLTFFRFRPYCAFLYIKWCVESEFLTLSQGTALLKYNGHYDK